MKRRTVIISKINDDHTAYVINVGIEELKIFKNLKDNGIELKDDGNISDEEILMILRHCCIDGFIEGVYSIENHFNRDQKQINIIKANIENKLKTKGLTIITHTKWTPSFDYDPGPINKRNYLTVIVENINKKESKLKELEEIIENNTAKIKQQNLYIDKTKEIKEEYTKTIKLLNKEKEEFDKLVERYRNGEKCLEEQRKNLPEDIKKLKDEIDQLNEQKGRIETEIKDGNNEIKKIENEKQYLEQELDRIKQTINEFNQLKEKIDNITLEKLSSKLLKIKSPDETLENVRQKFMRAVKHYLLNGRKLPQFENDAAKNDGLDEQTIQEIIDFVESPKI